MVPQYAKNKSCFEILLLKAKKEFGGLIDF
jgi:hypothetical protein